MSTSYEAMDRDALSKTHPPELEWPCGGAPFLLDRVEFQCRQEPVGHPKITGSDLRPCHQNNGDFHCDTVRCTECNIIGS
jgi:hypothetical protein